jgi:hypothetical protein
MAGAKMPDDAPMPTLYLGTRVLGKGTVVTANGEMLPWRLDLANHSPTGLEWGYGGSGPAQLALALLAHHTGDRKRALALYHRFKWAVIAGLDRDRWAMTGDEIDRWLILAGEAV